MYLERFIHGEIYKARLKVRLWCTTTRLRSSPSAQATSRSAQFIICRFLSGGPADIRHQQVAGDTDMLVKNTRHSAPHLPVRWATSPPRYARPRRVVVGDSLPQVVDAVTTCR